ncbi:MAG: phosphatidate cytidylyltransferase [Sphingomonas bacterium]|nr:phosphatidate cytidylyltransferase [Sphingomonas bacterium]
MTERSSAAAPAKRRSDLATRAVAGVVMIAVAVGALYAGGIAFWMLVSIAALLMIAEWAGLMHAGRAQILLAVLVMAAAMVGGRWLISDPLLTEIYPGRIIVLMYGLALAGALLLSAISFSPRLGAGILYAGLPALSLLYLRDQPQGLGIALWTLAIVWATDIGAYFAGRSIGGPKLSPLISPNKTWSGLIGGMIAALAVGYAITLILALPRPLLFLGPAMAVLAQLGDLFESWLKRRAGVKDSGRLLPGHGGVLDRLDGLVPVAVMIASLLMLDIL